MWWMPGMGMGSVGWNTSYTVANLPVPLSAGQLPIPPPTCSTGAIAPEGTQGAKLDRHLQFTLSGKRLLQPPVLFLPGCGNVRLAALEETLSHDAYDPVPGRVALWSEVVGLLLANPTLRTTLHVPEAAEDGTLRECSIPVSAHPQPRTVPNRHPPPTAAHTPQSTFTASHRTGRKSTVHQPTISPQPWRPRHSALTYS